MSDLELRVVIDCIALGALFGFAVGVLMGRTSHKYSSAANKTQPQVSLEWMAGILGGSDGASHTYVGGSVEEKIASLTNGTWV